MRGGIPDDDWARVHFLGRIAYDRFISLLQVRRVHVYLWIAEVSGIPVR